jgi:hypothetical protein
MVCSSRRDARRASTATTCGIQTKCLRIAADFATSRRSAADLPQSADLHCHSGRVGITLERLLLPALLNWTTWSVTTLAPE